MPPFCKLSVLFLALALPACFGSRESADSSYVKSGLKNEATITELATMAVAYTLETNIHQFRTDTLSDKEIRKKFRKSGYGDLVTVTFAKNNYRTLYDNIDSTVIFERVSFKGAIEIIYDFAAVKKNLSDDTASNDYILKRITDRIYYRRRPFPLM